MNEFLTNALTSMITALVTIPGTLLAIYTARKAERRKRNRESLEEIYKLSDQVNIWVQVTLRYLYKQIDKTDYYRVAIPEEHLEDYTKEPECPGDRLAMLVSFDAPSLEKYLPEYKFIVSELREVRYIYDTHKSKDTLNYYFWGITYDEYEKVTGQEVNTIEEFLQYVTVRFPKIHDELRAALNKLAQKG